jgi:hypothetical protein
MRSCSHKRKIARKRAQKVSSHCLRACGFLVGGCSVWTTCTRGQCARTRLPSYAILDQAGPAGQVRCSIRGSFGIQCMSPALLTPLTFLTLLTVLSPHSLLTPLTLLTCRQR